MNSQEDDRFEDPSSLCGRIAFVGVEPEKRPRLVEIGQYFASHNFHFITVLDTGGEAKPTQFAELTSANCRLISEKEQEEVFRIYFPRIGKLTSRKNDQNAVQTNVPYRKEELTHCKNSLQRKRRKEKDKGDNDANNTPRNKELGKAQSRKESGGGIVQQSKIEERFSPVVQQKKENPKQEIIGKTIRVKWPSSNVLYLGLVVGCQTTPKSAKHKVYYAEDETVEILDLSQREWNYCLDEQVERSQDSHICRRILVYCRGMYDDEGMQRLSEERFGKNSTKVAYEAFVVKRLDLHQYRILYTSDDDIEERRLSEDDSDWILLDSGVTDVDGLAVISWSYLENE